MQDWNRATRVMANSDERELIVGLIHFLCFLLTEKKILHGDLPMMVVGSLIKCPKCAKENHDVVEFCISCGAPLFVTNESYQRRISDTEIIREFLRENLKSGPRRAIILAIAAMLVLNFTIAYSLDLASYIWPPYPSENTPLVLTDEGIEWVSDLDPSIATNYTYMQYLRGGISDDIIYYSISSLTNFEIQDMLSSGTQSSVDIGSCVITDIAGDGEFNQGDSILFRLPDVKSDIIYRFALVYAPPLSVYAYWGEYSCALHDGKFYSWHSEGLNDSIPWWN